MKRIIKKIFLFSLVVSMLIGTSSVNIYANWIVNTFLDNFYETILNSTGVL